MQDILIGPDAVAFDHSVEELMGALPVLRGCFINFEVEQLYEDKGHVRSRTVYMRTFDMGEQT